jgi:hypothetical protein
MKFYIGGTVVVEILQKNELENGDLVFEVNAAHTASIKKLTVAEKKAFANKMRNYDRACEKARKAGLPAPIEAPIIPPESHLRMRRQVIAEEMASKWLNSKSFRRQFRHKKGWGTKWVNGVAHYVIHLRKVDIKSSKGTVTGWKWQIYCEKRPMHMSKKERIKLCNPKSNGKQAHRKALRKWERDQRQAKLDGLKFLGRKKPELSDFQ